MEYKPGTTLFEDNAKLVNNEFAQFCNFVLRSIICSLFTWLAKISAFREVGPVLVGSTHLLRSNHKRHTDHITFSFHVIVG